MSVAYIVLEYGNLIVAALAASDSLRLIYDVENDVRQITDTIYGQKIDVCPYNHCINDF